MAITKLVITGNTTAVGISSTPIEVSLAHTAKSTSVDPDDNITATNVQSALEELDDIKVDVTDGALTDPTISGTATVANLDVSGNTEFTGLTTLNQCFFKGQAVLDTDGGNTPLIVTKTYPSTGDQAGNLFVNDTDVVITSTQDDDFGGFVFKTEHFNTNILTRASLSGDGNISFYESTGTNVKFLWDSSNAFLGLGTITPANILTVGNTESSAIDQDATVGIKCDGNDRGIMLQENGGTEQWAIGVNADGDLNFYDSDTADAIVTFQDETGNVGIGTVPDQRLQVDGNIRLGDTATGVDDDEDYSITSGGQLTIHANDSAENDSNVALALKCGNSTGTDNDLAHISCHVNDNEIVRIDASNVGIGTDSADAKLHVQGGDIKITSDADSNANADGKPSIIFSEFNDDHATYNANVAHAIITYRGTDVLNEANYLGFGVFNQFLDTEDTLAEQKLLTDLNITRDGKVGIGTTEPRAKLHLSAPDCDLIQEMASDSTARLIEHRFDVDGVMQSQVGHYLGIVGTPQVTAVDPRFEFRSKHDYWFLGGSTGSVPIVTFKNDGKVGVNTTAPTGEFTVGTDVGDYAAQTVFYGQNNADNTSSIALSTAHTPRIGTIHSNSYYNNAGTLIKTEASKTSIEIQCHQYNSGLHGMITFGGTSPNSTTYNESMRLSSNGTLQLGDDDTDQGKIKVYGDDENIIQAVYGDYEITAGVVDNNIQSDSRKQAVLSAVGVNADLVFRTGNSLGNAHEAMRINDDRNLGIATAPASDVRINAAGVIRATSDLSLGYAAIQLQKGSLYSLKTIGGSNPGVRFDIDQLDSFKIHDNGKVNFTRGIRLGSGLNTVTDENLLDDYEEGTWTPTIFGSTSGSISGFNISTANYTKVGRLVTIQTYISAINDANDSMVGEVYMGGLPYVCNTGFTPISTAYANMFTDSVDRGVSGYIQSSTSYIKFTRGSNTSRMTTADRQAGNTNIMVTATYMTS